MNQLKMSERLIVAADYNPEQYGGRLNVKGKVLGLAHELSSLGVCIKLNSAARAVGLELVELVQAMGTRVFLDWKLVDIGETLATDGAFIREAKPLMVTAMCNAGVDELKRLKDKLPDTIVLGVTVPTTWTEEQCMRVYPLPIADAHLPIAYAVAMLIDIGMEADLDGFISAPTDARRARELVGKEKLIVTPDVRFADVLVKGDDQNQERVMPPELAIRSCANAVVMGRPITQADSPYDAAVRAIAEIRQAFA